MNRCPSPRMRTTLTQVVPKTWPHNTQQSTQYMSQLLLQQQLLQQSPLLPHIPGQPVPHLPAEAHHLPPG